MLGDIPWCLLKHQELNEKKIEEAEFCRSNKNVFFLFLLLLVLFWCEIIWLETFHFADLATPYEEHSWQTTNDLCLQLLHTIIY